MGNFLKGDIVTFNDGVWEGEWKVCEIKGDYVSLAWEKINIAVDRYRLELYARGLFHIGCLVAPRVVGGEPIVQELSACTGRIIKFRFVGNDPDPMVLIETSYVFEQYLSDLVFYSQAQEKKLKRLLDWI